jgi:antitoxin (DNA-binding transcriptional repressor) of toxin-antitoxin stability system
MRAAGVSCHITQRGEITAKLPPLAMRIRSGPFGFLGNCGEPGAGGIRRGGRPIKSRGSGWPRLARANVPSVPVCPSLFGPLPA